MANQDCAFHFVKFSMAPAPGGNKPGVKPIIEPCKASV
jgi:hypothetical protein